MKARAASALALPLAVALTGCGYHVSGRADLMPKTIKTIAIPAFGNGTVRARLSQLMTRDVTREFISRTRYTIVAQPEQADALLQGTLVNFAAYPTIEIGTNPATLALSAMLVLSGVAPMRRRVRRRVLPSRSYRARMEQARGASGV